MSIEMSVSIIAVSFVVLVGFLIATLLKLQKSLDSSRKDFHHLSHEATHLMEKMEALTTDLKSKSESLNFMFRPLKSIGKEHKESNETVREVIDLVSVSLVLFDKIKSAVKHYDK